MLLDCYLIGWSNTSVDDPKSAGEHDPRHNYHSLRGTQVRCLEMYCSRKEANPSGSKTESG